MSNKCYVVGGLGCSGKTVMSSKLGEELSLPVFHSDAVHSIVGANLGISNDELRSLIMPGSWKKPLVSIEPYKTVKEAFKSAYLESFNYLPPKELVIEGESLYWNKEELDVLREVLSDYSFRFFNVSVDYERWLKNLSKRKIDGTYSPKFRDESDYLSTVSLYEKHLPKNCMVIRDVANLDCSLTGNTVYQNEEFSNPKWDVFKFPEDMKGKTFMDVSCNTGWFCKKASERGASVSGVDISWQVLDVAMDRNSDGEFYLSKIEDFVPTKEYDYVLCSSAFHYYHHREEQVEKFSKMTKCLTIEFPELDMDDEYINYQGGADGEFCSVVSRGLMLKWLNKYFKKVERIGETIQPNSNNRPVYRCTN